MENEEIIGFEALYESMNKCRKGVLWKESVAHYFLNGIEETYKLSKELKNGTYKARKTTKFTITRPKKREIVSVCFRDRVYQRSLNDNAIYPVMTSSFIRDNWACQKGKGTDDARDRIKVFLRRMYRKYGNDFYVLQIDIHGYYPNMRHDIVRAVFKEKLSEEIFERAMCVLDGQYSSDVGYNPGSQMVQIAGISLTNNHDHKIKEQLRPDEFGRYMDDSILLHSSEKVLNNFKNEISKMLEEIGMEFNPKKDKRFLASKMDSLS